MPSQADPEVVSSAPDALRTTVRSKRRATRCSTPPGATTGMRSRGSNVPPAR